MSNYTSPKTPWGKIILVIVSVIVGLALISWGIFALNVATSGPRGQGEGIIKKNSAENWTAAQARFEQNYQEIVSSDQKILVATDALARTPDDRTAQQTLQGLQSYCLSVVADYNADARSFLAEEFRAADLPDQISTTDPTTDCK